MTIPNADRCIANTLIYEGGFAKTRADRGDWTSGQIGVGRLGGTAYGIAAMTLTERGLPEDFDLSTLNRDQAIALYRKKEWQEVAGDEMPKGLDQIIYDGTVNSGKGRGVPWVGRAVKCAAPSNAMAVASTARALSFDARRDAVKAACAARSVFLNGLSHAYDSFKNGWAKRVAGMEAIGVKMVLEDSQAPAPVIKSELQKEAAQAKTASNKAATGAAGTGTVGGGAATQTPDLSTVDWGHIIGGGLVTVIVVGLVIVFAIQAYKHFRRNSAYLAAANGTLGG